MNGGWRTSILVAKNAFSSYLAYQCERGAAVCAGCKICLKGKG